MLLTCPLCKNEFEAKVKQDDGGKCPECNAEYCWDFIPTNDWHDATWFAVWKGPSSNGRTPD